MRFLNWLAAKLLQEVIFGLVIVVLAGYHVEVVSVPVLLRSLSPLNFLVDMNLLIIEFKVAICYDVVVSEASGRCFLNFLFLKSSINAKKLLALLLKVVSCWGRRSGAPDSSNLK